MTTRRNELLQQIDHENRISSADGVLFFQAIAQRSGMNLTDLQCITILTSTGPLPAGQLAERMALTTGAITGVVNRLEEAGYVRREKDPADARRVVVRPVMEALEQAGANFLGSQVDMLAELTEDFDDDQLDVLLRFLRKGNEVMEREIARLRLAPDESASGVRTAPLGDVTSGRLVLATGAYKLRMRSETAMDELYRATYEGPQPKIEVKNGTVSVRQSVRAQLFTWKGHQGEITLNAAIPWEIELRRGAASVTADLRGLDLVSLTISGGLSEIDITLPTPSGVVPVRCTGGAAQVTFRRPEGVEAQIVVKGVATSVTLDQQEFAYHASKAPLRSEGFSGQPSRYEFEITGGANAITVR